VKWLALLAALAGCTVNHAYVVDPAALAAPGEFVAARRAKGGAAVEVRASAIDRASAQPQPDGTTRVVARARSRNLDAGVAMTLIGSAISIAGTIVFFTGLESRDIRYTTGLILAPSAEPLMIVGTVLWILALRRHPQER
jgi:hypothetical protein